MSVPTWEALELDRLPAGRVSRFWLTLAHDGMGRSVDVPVIAVRGNKPGPVFGLTSAVHGDELNGIPVIHRLFEWLDPAQVRGTIVAVPVVSVAAFRRKVRHLPDRDDLNHVFPGDPAGAEAAVYAHRFVEGVLKRFDRLVDLHTASRGRVNSLYVRVDLRDEVAARMARLQRPQIILNNPPSDGTLRGCADALGIPAITVEVGDPQRFQPAYIKRALAGLKAVLQDAGCLPRRPRTPPPPPVVCQSSRWLRTDAGGLLQVFPQVATPVKQGEVIARLTDVFGQLVTEYRAPEDGVVIGRSVDPVADTGARVVHLGRVADGELSVPSPLAPAATPPPAPTEAS